MKPPATVVIAGKPLPPERRAGQLELFLADFQQATGLENTNTIELFDALPLYQHQAATMPTDAPRVETLHFRKQIITASIRPAGIVQHGKMRYTFAGSRERLVESILRKMVSEPGIHVVFEDDASRGAKVPVLYTTISAIRKRMREIGHEFKIAEIRDALAILAGSHFSFSGIVNGEEYAIEMESAIIGRSYTAPKNDPLGRRSLERITFNPLLLKSIEQQTYRQIDWKRLSSLKRPGAIWFYQRITHHFTGVDRGGGPMSHPYHIDLSTILASSGMRRYAAVKDNVRQVRLDLREMAERGILDPMRPFVEKLKRDREPGKTRGPLKMIGAVWDLYLSASTAEEIIRSNVRSKKQKVVSSGES
jgi:hypothetical protein